MRSANIVWRELPSRPARYPYFRIGVSWPEALAQDDAVFQRTVAALAPLRPGGGIAPLSTSDHGPSRLMIDVALALAASIRDTLAELHRMAPSHAGADWIEFPLVDEILDLALLQASHRLIVDAAAWSRPAAEIGAWLEDEANSIRSKIGTLYPGDPTLAVVAQARLRRIPCRRISSLVPAYSFGHGARQQQIFKAYSGRTSYLGVVFSTNKTISNEMLRRAGLPVPKQSTVETWEMAQQAAAEIGFPVVVKPQTTDFGTAVETEIASEERLREAFEEARRHGSVLIESQLVGDDYRILVMNGKALRAYRRTPAQVVGNGVNTVAELIDTVAAERKRIAEYRSYGFAGKDDPQVLALLAKQGLSLSAVPPAGAAVRLRSNANVSTGGTTVSVADIVHPDNLRLAERAARVLGLDIAGVDFISPDISVSWLRNGGGICEVNPTPGMAYSEDTGRLLDFLTAGGRTDLRVPVILFIGAKEEFGACEEWLQGVARESSLTLTTVKFNVVFQNRRQISWACSKWKLAADVALLDRATQALLLCHETADLGEFPLALDAADLAFVSPAAGAGLGPQDRRALAAAAAIVVEGDAMRFRDKCRQLLKAAERSPSAAWRETPA